MFCPDCGALAYPDSRYHIRCNDHRCKYEGISLKYINTVSGLVDLNKVNSSYQENSLAHLENIVPKPFLIVDYIGYAFRLDNSEMIARYTPVPGYGGYYVYN